jgi:hypothetical protein
VWGAAVGIGALAGAAIGTAAVGAGTAYYGAQQQKKAVNATNNANAAQVQGSNDYNWSNYLATRGLIPTSPTSAGQMPSSSVAVNSRLPLWANVTPDSTGGGFLRKIGGPTTYTLSPQAITGPSSTQVAVGPVGGSQSLLQKATKDHLKILDPLGGLSKLFG